MESLLKGKNAQIQNERTGGNLGRGQRLFSCFSFLCFILSALLVNLSFDYPEGGLLVVLCGIKLLVVIKLVYTNFKTQYFALRIARCHLVAAMFVILKIPRPLFLRQNGTHKIIKQQTPRSHEN